MFGKSSYIPTPVGPLSRHAEEATNKPCRRAQEGERAHRAQRNFQEREPARPPGLGEAGRGKEWRKRKSTEWAWDEGGEKSF